MSAESKGSLYDAVGGRATLERVHKVFYDLIYKDVWIGKYFADVKQEVIENQQTDFMAAAMGGPDAYAGKFPVPAHKHMNITPELFDLRQHYLTQALWECRISTELAQKWLKIDGAFRNSLIKKSIADCQKRFNTDEILDFPNPNASKTKAA